MVAPTLPPLHGNGSEPVGECDNARPTHLSGWLTGRIGRFVGAGCYDSSSSRSRYLAFCTAPRSFGPAMARRSSPWMPRSSSRTCLFSVARRPTAGPPRRRVRARRGSRAHRADGGSGRAVDGGIASCRGVARAMVYARWNNLLRRYSLRRCSRCSDAGCAVNAPWLGRSACAENGERMKRLARRNVVPITIILLLTVWGDLRSLHVQPMNRSRVRGVRRTVTEDEAPITFVVSRGEVFRSALSDKRPSAVPADGRPRPGNHRSCMPQDTGRVDHGRRG